MGIEPFLITASLNAIVAQRLARKVCGDCKQEHDIPKPALLELQVPEAKIDGATFFKGAGCNTC